MQQQQQQQPLARARTASSLSEHRAALRQTAPASASASAAASVAAMGQKTVHEFNHDIHLLDEWVDQVLNRGTPSFGAADVSALLGYLQQYNVCFQELVRHTTALSPALARIMLKVWMGAFSISENVLKARNERFQTAQKLQADAQDLLSRGASESIAAKVQQDEYALQAAAHRAQARVLEAELEALKEQYAAVEKDNEQLRSVVYRHIYAMEYEPGNAQHPGVRIRAVSQGKLGEEAQAAHTLSLLRHRGVTLRQALNEQQEELQLLLQEASNEADRQAHLLAQLEKSLLHQQAAAAAANTNKGHHHHHQHQKPAVQHASHGSLVKQRRPLTRMTQIELGKNLVERVARTVLQLDKSVQTDVNMHVFRLGVELSTRVAEPIDDEDFGDDPPPLPILEPQDKRIPYAIRRLMTSFPEPLRIPSKREARNLIMVIYWSKIRDDARRVTTVLDEKSLAEYLYDYLVEHYTLTHIADVQTVQIIRALCLHAKEDSRISMFAAQLGLNLSENQWSTMDDRDTAFLLDLFRQLEKHEAYDADDDGNETHDTVARAGAMRAAMNLLQPYLMDRGETIVKKVQSFPALDSRPGFILLDPYVNIVLEQWQAIRANWNRHFSYLFRRRCAFFRVVHEVRFANDRGRKARDCVITRVEKEVARECSRRIMRNYHAKETEKTPTQRADSGWFDIDDADSELEQPKEQLVQPRQEVVELMDRDGFHRTLADLRCSVSMEERENIFQEGFRLATKAVYKDLDQIWSKHVDHQSRQPYYYNRIEQQAQWAEPYDEHTFQSDELDEATFISIATRHQLLAHSPLVCLLHLPPEKLWADADVYLRQMQEGTIARADSLDEF